MDIQYLSEYLEFIEIEKGLSQNTVDAYRRDLSAFFDFLEKKYGINEHIKSIERENPHKTAAKRGSVTG